MNTLKNALLTAAALVATLGAVGCNSSYTVDVRNRTDQPVVATIRQTELTGGSNILEQRRIGPGDRHRIGPVRPDIIQNVFLEVDFAGNVGHPGELLLTPGLTVINVHRTEDGSEGKIELEEVGP